jgi:membrane complex biogenesis BtpA family protein
MLTREGFAERYGHPALFGMVHLLPLPGSPAWGGSMARVIDRAIRDADALAEAGFGGLVVENFGDRPFEQSVGAVTVAAMSVVIDRLAAATDLSLGVNVLRNDARSAVAIAAATGATFVRVNVHIGTMATDQGLIDGDAAGTLRFRRTLGADDVAIFADLLVKHARPIVETDPVDSALELRERGLADAILVTGRATGAAADAGLLSRVRREIDAPLVVASGVSEENAVELAEISDGFIIGTSIKQDGRSDGPVDGERARRIVSLLK